MMPLASMLPSNIHSTSKYVSSAGVSSIDDILILEQPLLRLPVDELRTQLKTQQRLSEKDFMFCSNIVESKRKNPGESDASEVSTTMHSILQRLQQLRDKMVDLGTQAGTLLEYTQARTEYLKLLQSLEPGSEAFHDWCAIRLDRMVVDYMLRRGAFKSAEQLATQQHIASLVDLPVFEQIRKIEQSLVPDEDSGVQSSCSTALAWCSENKVTLRKAKSSLEIDLRLQEFIEQVRDRSPASLQSAVQYARKYLLPWMHAGDPAQDPSAVSWTSKSPKTGHALHLSKAEMPHLQQQAQRAMGLLASGPDSWCYADLYDPQRWKMLRDAFRAIALRVYDLPSTPLIHIALSAGLSSFKSHSCYPKKLRDHTASAQDDYGSQASSLFLSEADVSSPSLTAVDDRHPDCPICHTAGLGTLAREVPYSHHGNSRLICRITGKVMDDKNPPMCLPNGRVYSEEVRTTD